MDVLCVSSNCKVAECVLEDKLVVIDLAKLIQAVIIEERLVYATFDEQVCIGSGDSFDRNCLFRFVLCQACHNPIGK